MGKEQERSSIISPITRKSPPYNGPSLRFAFSLIPPPCFPFSLPTSLKWQTHAQAALFQHLRLAYHANAYYLCLFWFFSVLSYVLNTVPITYPTFPNSIYAFPPQTPCTSYFASFLISFLLPSVLRFLVFTVSFFLHSLSFPLTSLLSLKAPPSLSFFFFYFFSLLSSFLRLLVFTYL